MLLKIITFFSSRSFLHKQNLPLLFYRCENLRYESKSINPTCVSMPPTIFVPAFFTPHLTCAAVVVVVALDVVAVVVVVDDVFVVVFVVVTVVVVVTFEQKILSSHLLNAD